ncbi:antibiotic biosynthesis monooxygenase [Nitratireductor sp. XY-223]|uniref:antibiotic biosynthesis monooxygenase family protein n=1 Tax=Nitratireductor sp. XY-223 TaxID=2561926 RepID=UPI0010AA5B30|nr:antibiotic biosynthesis monooxygenase [Nitratireductor sp. XY-223]
MSRTIVETAEIKLREGVTEAEFIEASKTFQREFLSGKKGFLRRELLKLDERNYVDLVHWESRAAADEVMNLVGESNACRAFFSYMEMDEANPSDGVNHYESLAVYAP